VARFKKKCKTYITSDILAFGQNPFVRIKLELQLSDVGCKEHGVGRDAFEYTERTINDPEILR